MEKEKYSGYTIDQLLEDQEFIHRINNIQTDEDWELFVQANISSKENIVRARRIIQIFKVSEEKMSTDKKFDLWKNISRFSKSVTKNSRIFQIRSYLRIAASILLFSILGGTIYFSLNKKEKPYQFLQLPEIAKEEEPILTLTNGEIVLLNDDKPSLMVLKNQDAILVNNDSIVKNVSAKEEEVEELTLNEVSVPFGKNMNIILSDGTKVWLNAGSRFAFPQKFEGKKRAVFLEGEGYFEVVKNEKMPFIVSTNTVDVEVLGTKFNLSAYHSDNFCETVLLEGSVDVKGDGILLIERVNLKPNQKAVYLADKKELKAYDLPNASNYAAWVNGWYQFSDEDLIKVLDKLERYYNVHFITNQNLTLNAYPVSGKLDLRKSINEVMEILSKVANIDYRMVEKQIIIKDKI